MFYTCTHTFAIAKVWVVRQVSCRNSCAERVHEILLISTKFMINYIYNESMKKQILLPLIIFLLVVTGYFILIRTNKINPITKEINPKTYGPLCGEIVGICNDLVAVNCRAEVDGPFYYVNRRSGEIVGRCGGECFRPEGCPTPCPPKEWTCK